jgi:hypothetical protein
MILQLQVKLLFRLNYGGFLFVWFGFLSALKLGALAHTCNPIYSGGKQWKDGGLRPAQAKSFQDPHFNH